MGDYTPKLRKAADPVLEAGESLLAGIRGMRAGATAQIVGGGAGMAAGGVVGMMLADKITSDKAAAGRDAAAAAGLGELPPQVALGLTDRRLLVFKRGGITGGPRELVAFIPRPSIASIAGQDSGSKLKPDKLVVTLTDDTTVTFEIAKIDDLDGFVAAAG